MFRRMSLLIVLLLLAVPVIAAAQEDLTETYTSFDGALTFNYPAGWVAWGYDNTWGYVANSQAARETGDNNGQYASGQVVMSMHVVPEEIGSLEEAAAGMQAFYDDGTITQSGITVEPLSEPVLVEELGDAVEFTYLRTGAGFAEEVLDIVIVNGESGMIEVSVTAPQGETAQYHDQLVSIIKSLNYQPRATSGLVIPGSGPAPVAGTGNVVWMQERPWGSSPENFGGLRNLSISADDQIYVADNLIGIRVLDADGNLLHTITNSEIANYDDVEVLDDGTMWIASTYDSKVYHLDAQGNLLGSFGEIGTEPEQFDELSPAQMDLGPDGNLYFHNHHIEGEIPSGKIKVFTQEGTFVREFLTDPNLNDAADLFGNAFMAVGPDGTVYAADFYTPGVRAFAPDGTIVNIGIGANVLMNGIQQVAVGSDGSIYASPIMERTLYKFDPNGNFLAQYTTPIDFLSGMGLLSDGSIIIAGSSSTQDASVVLRLNPG